MCLCVVAVFMRAHRTIQIQKNSSIVIAFAFFSALCVCLNWYRYTTLRNSSSYKYIFCFCLFICVWYLYILWIAAAWKSYICLVYALGGILCRFVRGISLRIIFIHRNIAYIIGVNKKKKQKTNTENSNRSIASNKHKMWSPTHIQVTGKLKKKPILMFLFFFFYDSIYTIDTWLWNAHSCYIV